jgi:phospholipase C
MTGTGPGDTDRSWAARPWTRRQLLRHGAQLAGAAAIGSLLDGCTSTSRSTPSAAATGRRYDWPTPVARRQPGSLPFPDRAAGTDTLPEIDHIVVLMMENHSYDNYLGALRRPGADGFTFGPHGTPTNANPTADGGRLTVFPMPNDCQLDGKPSQEWEASHEQYDGGTNQGFVTSPSGPVAMGYWDRETIPFAWSLASTFPLADRWFCSLLGQTYPNRRYLTAATSAGMVDDVVSQLATVPPNGTIFDRLDHYGITWRDYHSTLPTVDVWLKDPSVRSPNVVPIAQFFTDAAAGTLPGFAIVDPNFDDGSEEDPQDIAVGEAFAAQVVHAITHGPAWPRTLLVWTYDEHGGYYDHVPPPPALAPDDIGPLAPVGPGGEPAYDGFHRYGFRVPAVVVSPYARRDHVTHVIHDHTSILAMVERKWNLPALTRRDANAADLMDFLDLSHPGFVDPPELASATTPASRCTPGDPGTIPPPSALSAPQRSGRS